MKIAFAEDRMHAYALGDAKAAGGAERQQWLLARSLAATGWSVVVGIREGLETGERKTIDGVQFVGVGQDHCLFGWRRLLVSERPDWWYRRTADHLLGPAVEFAKLAGVKTIFAAAFDSDIQPRKALSRRRRWWPLYAWGLERTERIFVQHEGQLAFLPTRWRSKAFVIPSIAAQTNGIRLALGRKEQIAWVAMLREPKRPDLLIEIARKAPELQFVVCGGPSSHRSRPGYGDEILQALHSLPNIDYRGQVPPDEARQCIADSAVYLLTSDEEGFPNTFLEAWSSGTPVVSLKVDPGSTIRRKSIGFVTGTVENALAALRTLMKSAHLRQEIAFRGRNYVAETHSEAVVVVAFERAIRSSRDKHLVTPEAPLLSTNFPEDRRK